MDNIIILNVAHKKFQLKLDTIYKTIRVGLNKKEIAPFMYDDSNGENIAEKNDLYNEFTALYYAYKNIDFKNVKYIGLVHYRRYFFNNFYCKNHEKTILCEKDIKDIMNKHKVILPAYYKKPKEMKKNQFKNYKSFTEYEVIKEKYPEFLDNYVRIQKAGYRCGSSMFICGVEDFKDYCDWVFDILFECEKRIMKDRGYIKSRELGFIGEWLPNLYFSTIYRKKDICRKTVGRIDIDYYSPLKDILYRFGFKKIQNLLNWFDFPHLKPNKKNENL